MSADLRVRRKAARTVRMSDFSLDMDSPSTMHAFKKTEKLYNFQPVAGGGLRGCGGFQKMYELTGEGRKLAYYRRYDQERKVRDDRLVAATTDGVYYVNLYGESAVAKLDMAPFECRPDLINYRLDDTDVLIMSGEGYPLTVWNGTDGVEVTDDAPSVSSMCMHSERLFATESGAGDRLWFSDDMDPRNWSISLDEAGYIELPDVKGKLIKAVSFAGYVYVFRSYGIMRVTAFGDQTQFSVSELFSSTGRIYPDSVTVCGDKIIFLADDGLYAFDGLSANRLRLGIDTLLSKADKSNLACGYFRGKFFMALGYDFNDGAIGCEHQAHRNNAVVITNFSEGTVSIMRGVDITSIAAVLTDEGGFLACLLREDERLFICQYGENFPSLHMQASFAAGDFGYPDRLKLIRKLHIETNAEVKVTLLLDGAERMVTVSAGASVPVFAACKKFGIRLDTEDSAAEISALSTEVELI